MASTEFPAEARRITPPPGMYDSSNNAGFTAVNGEVNKAISFRPYQHEDRNTTTVSPKGKERMTIPYTNGTSSVDAGYGVKPEDGSPPSKRARPNVEGGERPSVITPSASSGSAATSPDNDYTAMDDRSASPQALEQRYRPSETLSNLADESSEPWNQHSARPASSRGQPGPSNGHFSADSTHPADAGPSNDANPPASGDGPPQPPKRKREFSRRTKTGCHTCRERKKKCDEERPTCGNCIRGKFVCAGYGPKPPLGWSSSRKSGNKSINIAAKGPGEYNTLNAGPPPQPEQYYHGPPRPYAYEPTPHQMPPPHHPPPPPLFGPPNHEPPRENWHYQYAEAPHIHLQQNKLPHSDYAQIQLPPFVRDSRQPPPDVYTPQPYRPPTNSGPSYGGHESVHSHEPMSRRGSGLHLIMTQKEPPMNERSKMLLGKPYQHYRDNDLIADRMDCKTAVDLYNRAALPSEGLSQDERAGRFAAILNPALRKSRSGTDSPQTIGRAGRCGTRTIVEAPFSCVYGYNLIIGDDVVIESGCSMQDASEISIGNKCIIGQNVTFIGMTASLDATKRDGGPGTFIAGSITLEPECFIGSNVTILPFKTIGKGAIVGAGSVVTRNVKPYTVVAGNPAKEVRSVAEHQGERHHRTEIQAERDAMVKLMPSKRYNRNYMDVQIR